MLLLSLLVACSDGPFAAPPSSEIQLSTSSYTFTWNSDFYFEDGLGYVYAEQAQVSGEDRYGRSVGLPSIEVEVQSHWPGVYILPEGAVKTVSDFEEACANKGSISDQETAELCDTFYSDESGSQYYEVSGEYLLADEGEGDVTFRPNFLRGVTDSRGIVPFYLFFDSLPGGDTDFSITFNIGVDTDLILISTVNPSEE